MVAQPDTMQPYSDRLEDDDAVDFVAEAIISGIGNVGIGVPDKVKKLALGFDLSHKTQLKALLEQASKVAKQLLLNEELGNILLSALQPSQDHQQLGKNIQQGLRKSITSASLPSLAQMQQYAGSKESVGENQDPSNMVERLGGEGGGDEELPDESENSEPQTGGAEDEQEGPEESVAPPGSAVSMPEEAKESAVTDQGMINLSDEDKEKHKARLAGFAQEEQGKQLDEKDEENEKLDEESQENEQMRQTGMAADLQRSQQQDRQRKSSSMQTQESQRRIQEAEAASAEGAGGGQDAIEGEARSKSEGGKLTERGVKKAGDRIGANIKARMKDGEFKGFLIAMIFAISKDAIDWIDPEGTIPFLVNIFLLAALNAILLGEGTYFKRLLIKKFIGKYIIAAIAEFIPGFNLFPTYTIGILLMKAESDKEVKKQKKQYNIVASEQAKLLQRVQRTIQRGPLG